MKYAVVIFFIVFKSTISFSQPLSLATIVNLYKLDSSSFKQYCEQKGYSLYNRIGNSKFNTLYYRSSDNFLIARDFTNDTTFDLPDILYSTSSLSQFLSFKSSLKSQGYKMYEKQKNPITKEDYELREGYNKEAFYVQLISSFYNNKWSYLLTASERKTY